MNRSVVPDINTIVAGVFVFFEISYGVFVPAVVYLNLYLVGDIQAFEIVFPDKLVTGGNLNTECHTLFW